MQEDVRREGEWMIPSERDDDTNIRKRGEDVRSGEVLLRPGQRLGASELAVLAQLGRVEPLVSPPVRALHIATGRELVDPSCTPAPGEIRDTNSTLIAALLRTHGAALKGQRRCGDELELLIDSIRKEGDDAWDLLLISGGASVGDYDFGARALAALGFEIHFAKVNLRPGKPLVFATRGNQAAFVIPGNPVSHFVLFHLAITVALDSFRAAPVRWMAVEATLAEEVAVRGEPREVFFPARLEGGCTVSARPARWQSSGDLAGLIGADGLLRLPPRSGPFPAGARVECVLTRNY
jgi:molybdopterin molybdotransferase